MIRHRLYGMATGSAMVATVAAADGTAPSSQCQPVLRSCIHFRYTDLGQGDDTWAIRRFKVFIEPTNRLPVDIGAHSIPQKYMDAHGMLLFGKEYNVAEIAQQLLIETEEIKTAYN